MRIHVAEHIKSAVIDAWISGNTRDNIASQFNISTGSVSNIKAEWQNRIGIYDANNLKVRISIKKARMSPIQYVKGLRINNIINQLGINEDHLFDFLNKLYNESKEQRLSPADIARLVKVINSHPEINSLNQLPKNIHKRREEKIRLGEDIYYKKLEIQRLDHEKEMKRKEILILHDDLESSRKEMQDESKIFKNF